MIDTRLLDKIYREEHAKVLAKGVGDFEAHRIALLHVYDYGYGEAYARYNKEAEGTNGL